MSLPSTDGFWPLLLALVLTAGALGACSDDGGSAGDANGSDSDAAFDTPTDTPGEVPPDSDTRDATGDAEDAVSDGVSDAPTDGDGGDAVDDSTGDSEDDVVPDLGTGDQGDLGTEEFPVCPYETDSATADCEAVCAAVVACDGEELEESCAAFCATALRLFNQGAATAFSNCITGTECGAVPDGEELGAWCVESSIAGLPANADATAACQAVDAAIETCSGETSTFDGECGFIAPVLRDEAVTELEACAEAACESIENCASAAMCDLLL